MSKTIIHLPDEVVMRRIHVIRGHKVMLDRDLAELYVVETKYLKRQVKRNIERFPEDFMFELSKEEFEEWRRQNVTSRSSDTMGLRYAPYAFTEQGLAMLSSVLNSQRAIAVNIQIIRLFTKMREVLFAHKDLLLQVEKIKGKTTENSRDIKVIFAQLKRMREEEQNKLLLAQIPKEKTKQAPIGFRLSRRKKR